jgi:hypothetical protein
MTGPSPTPEEISADMVLQVAPVRPDKAARVAVYITARYAGQRPADACNTAGIQQGSKSGYEKFIPLLRERHGLPALPAREERPSDRDPSAYGRYGAHVQHHVRPGVKSAACPHCQEASQVQEAGGRHG